MPAKCAIPIKLIVDNGAAYRANTPLGICMRLGHPSDLLPALCAQGKSKLERWHRTFRDQFLSELDERHITHLDELNARLWAWVEQVYHTAPAMPGWPAWRRWRATSRACLWLPT